MTYPVTPPAPAVPPSDIRTGFRSIPGSERALALVAIVVLAGWIVSWLSGGDPRELFRSIFAALSFLGSLIVILIVSGKLFGVRPIPAAMEQHVIAIAALLPIVGYLLGLVNPPYLLMQVGGSLVLGYLALITYWRRYIPDRVTKSLATEPGGTVPAPGPVVPAGPPPAVPAIPEAPLPFPPPPAVP
jgi:hypothetical protein